MIINSLKENEHVLVYSWFCHIFVFFMTIDKMDRIEYIILFIISQWSFYKKFTQGAKKTLGVRDSSRGEGVQRIPGSLCEPIKKNNKI